MSDQPSRPTISIYQNPDHVAGILQQLFGAPLVVDESREQGSDETSGQSTQTGGDVGLKGGASVPFFGEVGLNAGGSRSASREAGLASTARTVQNFTYSQAYYLYVVRTALLDRGLLKTATSAADAAELSSGDFVEYQATFRPNELHSVLDILTPDLIAAITEHQVKSEGLKLFPAYTSIDELKVYSEGLHQRAQVRANIARAIAEAVRVDFRAEKTREFYGQIGDVTAVTICDHAHFVVEDEDRILDGRFTVLGKVTSPVESEVPILARNKVLDRLKPESVDELFAMLRTRVAGQTERWEPDEGPDMSDALNVALQSRIGGASFKVVPIAIFA